MRNLFFNVLFMCEFDCGLGFFNSQKPEIRRVILMIRAFQHNFTRFGYFERVRVDNTLIYGHIIILFTTCTCPRIDAYTDNDLRLKIINLITVILSESLHEKNEKSLS